MLTAIAISFISKEFEVQTGLGGPEDIMMEIEAGCDDTKLIERIHRAGNYGKTVLDIKCELAEEIYSNIVSVIGEDEGEAARLQGVQKRRPFPWINVKVMTTALMILLLI